MKTRKCNRTDGLHTPECEEGRIPSECSEHTPTPWKITKLGTESTPHWVGNNEDSTVSFSTFQKANAEFIVRAVNSHEALLEASKRALFEIQATIAANPQSKTDRPEIEAQLRKAIAQAEGKE